MAHIIKACGEEWNSPEGGRRTHAAHNTHNLITMSLEDVGMHYLLSVMFHVCPVVKGRVNTAVKDH